MLEVSYLVLFFFLPRINSMQIIYELGLVIGYHLRFILGSF